MLPTYVNTMAAWLCPLNFDITLFKTSWSSWEIMGNKVVVLYTIEGPTFYLS